MKKILTIIVIACAVFLIYLGFRDEKVYYLSIGDYISNGVNPYGVRDYGYTDYIKDALGKRLEVHVNVAKNSNRIIDLISNINDNIAIDVNGKTKTMQNALIKADLITMSIGMNDLLNNLSSNMDINMNDLMKRFEQILNDYDKLFKLMRKYSKEDIYLIGMYNTTNLNIDEFISFVNQKLGLLCDKYDIKYISISEDVSRYVEGGIYLNNDGYKVIADKIIDMINVK